MADVDRGVSTTLGYTLNLAVATILITGLLVAAGGYVEDQQERAIRSELDVIGSRLAGDISTADRLARAGPESNVTLRVTAPGRTTGATYTVGINQSGNDQITLSTTNPAVTVQVPFRSNTTVAASSTSGGTFVIRYGDATGNEITVVSTDG